MLGKDLDFGVSVGKSVTALHIFALSDWLIGALSAAPCLKPRLLLCFDGFIPPLLGPPACPDDASPQGGDYNRGKEDGTWHCHRHSHVVHDWMVCVRPPVSIRVPGICATHDVQGVFCVYVYIEEQCPEKLTSKMQPSVASTVKTEEREPTLLIEFSRVVCTMI
uniref:Uncharacterized protein n=1 Tax=Dunaliella tertiolecta TaxID=3047 RepID=A0A6S8L163_DUNTE